MALVLGTKNTPWQLDLHDDESRSDSDMSLASEPLSDTVLAHLPPSSLEELKSQLEAMRQQILRIQNRTSPLFHLPGEIRNRIFLLAMHGELYHRLQNSRTVGPSRRPCILRMPAFLETSRQIRAECAEVWLAEVVVWEEYDKVKQAWCSLAAEEIRVLCTAKSRTTGRKTLIIEPVYCSVTKSREAVQTSGSVCPRKGMARAAHADVEIPHIRWWIW